MPESGDVRVEHDGEGVATIILNRPARRNALTGETMKELANAVTRVGEDPEIRCVILTGEQGFCSGVDIDWLSSIPTGQILEQGVDFYRLPQSIVRALIALPVPTIAAVDGAAVGLGLDLAMACDCRFIGPQGWLRQGWAAAGLIPATGGALLMSNAASPGTIWRLMDGQPKVHGDQAQQLGLGEPGVPTALDAARRRAAALATLPSATARGYVELTRTGVRAGLDAHLEAAAEIQLDLFANGRYKAALADQLARAGQPQT